MFKGIKFSQPSSFCYCHFICQLEPSNCAGPLAPNFYMRRERLKLRASSSRDEPFTSKSGLSPRQILLERIIYFEQELRQRSR